MWDPEHHAAAQAIALGRHRDRDERHLQLVASTTTAPAAVGRLDLGDGDYDVATPDLDARYSIGGGELA